MTETTILARIAVEGAEEAMRRVADLEAQVEKLGQSQSRNRDKSRDYDQSLREVSQGAMVAGAGLLAMAGGAVFASANFDQAMSGVAAVAGATAEEMATLEQAALDAGKATVFSASEAATAEAELAKAGVSTSDILGGALTGSLNLAAAGQLDLATAATITGQALNIFKLEGSQSSHVADLLAAGANKSAADVQQLGDALAQGGLVAKGANLSIEETVGTLALFADNALVGSDAGTSLKSMLLALQGPSDKSKALMDELGLAVYDASGQFIGMEGLAGQLNDQLGGLTQAEQDYALAQIFGNDAVRAARALMSEGADGVREYTAAVDDQGAASRMAGVQLDNLSGDLEALKGSIETALIASGSKANDTLRGLTQSATGMVNAFAEAPGWLQGTTVGFAGVSGGVLLTAGTIGSLIPKLRETKNAFMDLPTGAKAGIVGVTAALTVGALVVANWGKEKEAARQRVVAFTEALRADNGVLGANSKAHVENELTTKNLADDLNQLTGHLASGRNAWDVLTAAVGGDKAAHDELNAAIMETGGAQSMTIGKNRELVDTIDELIGAQAESKKQWDATAESERTAADVSAELAAAEAGYQDLLASGVTKGARYDAAVTRLTEAKQRQVGIEEKTASVLGTVESAFDDTTDAVNDAETAVDDWKKALDEALGLPLDLEAATSDWYASVDSLTESVKENGLTLDITTEKGRANRDEIAKQVGAAEDHAAAVFDQVLATEGLDAAIIAQKYVLAGHRDQLVDQMIRLGYTRQAAEDYATELGLIPSSIATQVTVEVVANIAARVGGAVSGAVSTAVTAAFGGAPADGRPEDGRARGGPVDAGSTYLVGEEGPELLTMGGTGGYITPNDKIGAGGTTITIEKLVLPGVTDTQSLVDELMAWTRDNGPLPLAVAG